MVTKELHCLNELKNENKDKDSMKSRALYESQSKDASYAKFQSVCCAWRALF